MTPLHVTGTVNILDHRINIRRFYVHNQLHKSDQNVLKIIFDNQHFNKIIFTLLNQKLLLSTLIHYTNSKCFNFKCVFLYVMVSLSMVNIRSRTVYMCR
jgi:hypothetical protein